MNLQPYAPFLGEEGPHSDVVMSCRVRLARNFAGFPFVGKARDAQRAEIVNLARRILLDLDPQDRTVSMSRRSGNGDRNVVRDDRGDGKSSGMYWVDLPRSDQLDRELLVERHLISRNLANSSYPRGVAYAHDESVSVMVNEEDHLRMQMLRPGLQLEEVYRRLNAIDDAIEQRIDYAFSPRWGYLTACPTNVGSGMRLSAMLHLPGVKLTKEIEKIKRAAKDLNLAVRGYYGEGSDSAGDFYQISNQTTLGKDDQELLDEFHTLVIPRMIDYEQVARAMLLKNNMVRLEDRIHRALAVLRHARLLSVEEAMRHLSKVRLGAAMGLIDDIDMWTVNRLFLQIQNAHLTRQTGDDSLSSDDLLENRADLVRRALA